MIIVFFVVIVVSYLWFAIFPSIFPTGGWDWLSFLGSALSLFGTVFLGLLAIWQNDKLRELADKKDKHYRHIENEKTRLENLPLFSINTNSIFEILEKDQSGAFVRPPDNPEKYLVNGRTVMLFTLIDGKIFVHNGYFGIKAEDFSVSLAIVNCGNNAANNIQIIAKYGNSEIFYPYTQTLSKNQVKYFFIDFYQNKEEKTVELIITYSDIFQNKYKQLFNINYYIDHSGISMIACKIISPQTWVEKSKFFSNDEE